MKILEFYELHAITGDVQKVYSAATNLEQEMNCKCEHWQQCDICKPKLVAIPKPHKHAAMIKEWADNPSRVVECFRPWGGWAEIEKPTWCLNIEYRFADQATPVKPEIVSSLGERECLMAYRDSTDHEHGVLRVADAAAKRAHAEGYQAAIDAVCAMPSKSTLSEHCLDTAYANNGFTGIARISIFQFQADVKKLLGGV